MNKCDELPKGADDALAEGGYEVGPASAVTELEMLTEAAAKAAEGPDGKDPIEALLAPLEALEREDDKDVDGKTLRAVLRAIAAGSKGLDELDSVALKGEVQKNLGRLKVPRPGDYVAALFGKKQAAEEEKDDGTNIDPTEPCEYTVDGGRILDQLVAMFRRYMVMPEGSFEAIALWVVHTYLLHVLDLTPRLTIYSPTWGCGKSNLLTLLGSVVEKPLLTSGSTPASMFRIMEACQPTLILDEADAWMKENEGVRQIVNSGYLRPLAWIMRCSGDDNKVVRFNSFGAMAIAGIGKMDRTIMSRSIVNEMRRKRPSETVEEFSMVKIFRTNKKLKKRCARWAQDLALEFAEGGLAPEMPDLAGDRAADCWRVLIGIADSAGGCWPERAREAARRLAGGSSAIEDDDPATRLLSDVRDIFEATGREIITTTTLHEELLNIPESPWQCFGKKEAPLHRTVMGKMLSGFGVTSKQEKIPDSFGTKKNQRCYARTDLQDAWERYLPQEAPPMGGDSPVTLLQHSEDKGLSENSPVTKPDSVTGRKCQKTASTLECNRVTGEKGGVPRSKPPETEHQLHFNDTESDQEPDNEADRRAV